MPKLRFFKILIIIWLQSDDCKTNQYEYVLSNYNCNLYGSSSIILTIKTAAVFVLTANERIDIMFHNRNNLI